MASKGFSVQKLTPPEGIPDINPRQEEITRFINDIQDAVGALEKKRAKINANMGQIEAVLKQEEARVDDYYLQFF